MVRITDLMLEATNKDIIKNLEQRANDITHQKDTLEANLQKHKLLYNMPSSKEDIRNYLLLFLEPLDETDTEYMRRIIDCLIYKIFVYNDKILIYFSIFEGEEINFNNITLVRKSKLFPCH